MIEVLSTNITSPLGTTTEQNYQAVRSGGSALSSYASWKNIPETFTASLFNEEQVSALTIQGFTFFESIVIHSVREALTQTDVEVASKRTVFILSTTKANVSELASDECNDGAYLKPGSAARKIASYLGFTTDPVVVCNACISGVTAQILADRLLSCGHYDHAVVCGADCISPFVLAGFMSFKSLSPVECRPFDIERLGLNLGEAASTIIFGISDGSSSGRWKLVDGALNNDAYHISAPAPNGDGALGVIEKTLKGRSSDSLAMVNVHGTATMFNDQMESKAVERSSLSHIPLSALKGYYGHTLGASGTLETIISMRALEDGCILPVRGYEEQGVSGRITISNTETATDKQSFLKMISGFGGCNGAVLYTKDAVEEDVKRNVAPKVAHKVHLTESSLTIDGKDVEVSSRGKALLTEIYRTYIGDYPKFHKMDMFTKLVFAASELLIRQEGEGIAASDRAIILFNASSSIVADRKHLSTIDSAEGFFPSPSVFLYTLPNIVTGEIAIKHNYTGETSLYILNERNDELIARIVDSSFARSGCASMITGWVECGSEDSFEADIEILTE